MWCGFSSLIHGRNSLIWGSHVSGGDLFITTKHHTSWGSTKLQVEGILTLMGTTLVKLDRRNMKQRVVAGGFTSCSLCLPDLFTYPNFRGARAIVVLQSYVGLQPPWEPHRRRCFLSRNLCKVQDVGKNMPFATFGTECYSAHPFLWNFRSFLTCISRYSSSQPFWFRWGDFIPPKSVVVGAVFCADASRFVGQKLVWIGLPQKGSARNQEDDVIPILLYTSWHSWNQKTVRVCIIYDIYTLWKQRVCPWK